MAARAARRREHLPEHLRPEKEDDATRINEAIWRINTADVAGWKIGATGPAAQKALGLTRPFTGFIPADCVDANGARYEFARMMRPIVESEYAFRMARTLPPKAGPYSRAEVEAAIGSLIIGLEIPESRLPEDHGLGAFGTLIDHGGTGRFVIGREIEDWRGVDCTDQDVVLTFDGEEVGRGRGSAMMGHPVEALTWFANHLSERGIPLEAGIFVTTGSCTGVVQAMRPLRAVADFGPAGKVEATFA